MGGTNSSPHRNQRFQHSERGANLIEFALSALVLLLIVAGTVDFGSAFQNYIILTNAAREGARTASHLPCSSSNRAAYKSAVVSAAISEAALSNVTVVAADVTYSPNIASTCPAAGSPVVVSVRHTFNTQFASLMGFATINLLARAEMIFFGNDVAHPPAAEPVSRLQLHPTRFGEIPC